MHAYKDKIIPVIKRNKVLVTNFFYVSLLQVFLLVAPLITYPYLVRVLGMELYGIVITAQILASYASIIIDFGSNIVCAKHVSINRDNNDKLSEIISSVLSVRFVLWIICFFVYLVIVAIIPEYKKSFPLFLLSYGLTLNEVLFPQFFFQGIEKMKYSTIVNIVIKLIFIALVFVFVRSASDYLYVPVLYTLGYMFGGIYALWIIFKKMELRFMIPQKKQWMQYVKDSAPLFATDLVCTIKDKFNYLLIGIYSGMGNVVVYDLGMKIYGITSKPAGIISTVLFPKSAKERNIKTFKKILVALIIMNIIIITLVNLFLPLIVPLFVKEPIDVLPIRLFTLAPLFSTTSAFMISNMCIAYGYSKFALYSIMVTTGAYLFLLAIFYFTHFLSNLYAFVLLALVSYFIEFLYRIYACISVARKSIMKKNIDL